MSRMTSSSSCVSISASRKRRRSGRLAARIASSSSESLRRSVRASNFLRIVCSARRRVWARSSASRVRASCRCRSCRSRRSSCQRRAPPWSSMREVRVSRAASSSRRAEAKTGVPAAFTSCIASCACMKNVSCRRFDGISPVCRQISGSARKKSAVTAVSSGHCTHATY